VLVIYFISAFHAKIIYHGAYGDVTSGVLPYTRCVRAMCISVFCEVGDELLVCKDSGLRESIHSFHNFNQHISIMNQVQVFVLDNYGVRDNGDVDAHVFPDAHWRPGVKVFKVKMVKRPFLVEMVLGNFGGGHAYFARIVDQIPAHSEVHTFDLSVVRALGCHTPCIGGPSLRG
jgi:hypothetical protein